MQKADNVTSHVRPSMDGKRRLKMTLATHAARPGSMEAGAV